MHPLQQVNGMNYLYYTSIHSPVREEHLLHEPLNIVGSNRVLNLIAVRPVVHREASPSVKHLKQTRLCSYI